jgi:hypothetical protein
MCALLTTLCYKHEKAVTGVRERGCQTPYCKEPGTNSQRSPSKSYTPHTSFITFRLSIYINSDTSKTHLIHRVYSNVSSREMAEVFPTERPKHAMCVGRWLSIARHLPRPTPFHNMHGQVLARPCQRTISSILSLVHLHVDAPIQGLIKKLSGRGWW